MARSLRRRARVNRSMLVLGTAVGAAVAGLTAHVNPARAASGTWTSTTGGNWNLATTANWNGGTVADGADSTADFSTIDITADATVTLTEPRTIGNLTFGDTATATAASWILNDGGTAANVLTLSTTTGTPQITVNTLGTGKSVTLGMGIAGNSGFLKSGIGQLILSSSNNTYTGTTTVNRGVLTFANSGAFSNVAAGSIMVNPAGAVSYSAASVTDSTFLSKINTASSGALAITSTDAATNFNFTSGALTSYTNMGIGAVLGNTVTYTGTITPAASTYRLGGGGGTLQVNSVLSGANNLVVGNGSGATGTVILGNSANTYSGTTAIATGVTLQVGTGGTFASISTGNITDDGQFTINRTGSFTFANNISGAGTVNQSAGSMTTTGTVNVSGALNLTGQSTQTRWTVNGNSVTFGGQGTFNSANSSTSSGFVLTSGSATFNGGFVVGSSQDGCLVQLNGGTFSTTTLNIVRTFNTGNSDTLPTAGQTSTGLYINGATTSVNDLRVSTGNAGATARIDSGSLTVSNAIVLGGQNNTSAIRWSILDVNGGTVTVNGAGGITLGADSADHAERSILLIRNGTATTEKISFGDLPTLVAGRSALVISDPGSLYVGSGGIVTGAGAGYTTIMNLAGGTLGAKADWSTAQAITLTGGNATIKAADAADVPHNITFGGSLSGGGTFTKTGGGSLILTNTASYSGNPAVTAGTLIGNSSNLRNNIANGAAIVFDQASAGTFNGVISGSGSVAKSNAGNLTFASPQTYSGATTVSGGSLRIVGTQGSSGVSVANGAALAVGTGGATINALTLGSAGGDAMTLGVNDGSGLQQLNVVNSNGLSTAGTTTIDVGSTGLTLGTHTLIDYSGSILGSGYGGFALGSLPPRVVANLVNNTGNTSVDLNVTLIDIPRWEGTDGTNPTFWDINTTANWREATSGNLTKYLESTTPADQVLFNDAAAGTTTVDITTTVQPSGVTINNGTKNYTFIGSGKISGATGLIKQGTGTLTISNTGGNDYTGTTTINAGAIVLGADNALPAAGSVNVNGGTLDVDGRSASAGSVTLTSGSIIASGGSLSAGSFDVRSGTIAATLAGGTMTKTTAGTVQLNTPAGYTGNTTIAQGTLQLGATNALPVTGQLIMGSGTTGGTLEMNGFSQDLDRLNSGGTAAAASTIVNSAGGAPAVLRVTSITSNSSYGGVINGNVAVVVNGLKTLTLSNTGSTYTGGTTINNGGTLVIGGDGSLGAVPGSPTTNVTITGVSGAVLAAAANVGAFTLNANRTILLDGVTGNIDSGGNANTITIAGEITGSGHLGKSGNGTVILPRANSYTGNTAINAGNLRILLANAISSGPITINGGSLQLDNGVSISNGVTSNSSSADNMIDSVGASGMATYAGTLSFGTSAQLRLAATGAGATLIFAGSSSSGNAFVANQGQIVMVGTSSITGSQGLIARPAGAATIDFTLRDSSSASFSGISDLGNARNVSSANLTVQDTASYSTLGTFNLLDTTATTAASTVNLNGGTFTSGAFLKSSNGSSQTATIKFNGGILKVGATSNTYLPALTGLTVNVQDGGAIIDTNSFDAVVAAPLTAAGTGGLTKNGAGTLTMSGASTYTGPTVVNAGKLTVANSLATSSSVTLADNTVLEIAAGGGSNRVLKTGAITLGANAKIDIQDNKLVTSNPVGIATAGAYSDVSRLIQLGRNGGDWSGTSGIVTSQTFATTSTFTSIGVAKGSEAKGVASTATAVWAGQTVTGSDTLVMYTYGGDANLDGKINVDDYGRIDFAVPLGIAGWANGDFNYDGKINVDDYGIIDFNVGIQGPAFFAGSGIAAAAPAASLPAVTAVPEPASISILALGAAGLLSRRTRRTRRRTR